MIRQTFTSTRVVIAVMIGLLGSAIIWFAVPYNNFRLKNTYVADDFLPEIVIGLLVLLILGINPLLRLIGKKWMLSRRQVALITSILLFATIIPSNGLMRMFPRLVAETNQGMNANANSAKLTVEANLPQVLYPDKLPTLNADGKIITNNTPVSNQFLDELDPGASIPWSAWLMPMASWGMLIIALWAMMLGMGGVVFPQWRDRERLPFPLLNVYHSFIGEPDEPEGRLLPTLFTSPAFWTAAGVVFAIHALRGLNVFTGAFPSFPLNWQLGEYYNDSILRFAPVAFKWQAIFFSIVGVAYFMPNRYAVSIWGINVIYSWYVILGRAYVPAFNDGQINDQAFGALFAIAVWVLWLGRGQWARVGKAMLGKASGGDESRRDAVAGWMFAIGCAGIVLWLYWAGCALWWSVLAMIGCALISLLMARIIAETGIPVLWLNRFTIANLTALFPLGWQSPSILLFTGVLYAMVTRTTAVSAAVMSTMAMGVDREATPKYRSRLLVGGLAVLVLGFIVCGAVHLNMGYNYADLSTQAKTGASSMDVWSRVSRTEYHFFTADRAQQGVGFGIGTAMLWACSRFPSWPLHPVGFLFCQMSIGNLIWFSVFLGWLIKVMITNVLGGGAYRKARPVFLGLILGELLAVIVWALVPVLIVWITGADPATVPRYTLMQYP